MSLEHIVSGVLDNHLRSICELLDDFGLFLQRRAAVQGASDQQSRDRRLYRCAEGRAQIGAVSLTLTCLH